MSATIRAFASHNWGKDAANHRRVVEVVRLLQERGIGMWLDENNMKGNILTAMCKGIDTSHVVLIFVTKEYIDKVENGAETDNVRREFMYASRTPEKLVPIRFDPDLSVNWSGPVGMVLGSHLYHDLSRTVTTKNIDDLVRMIGTKNGKTLWKHAVAATAAPHSPVLRLPCTTPDNRRVSMKTLTISPPNPPMGAPKKTTVKARVQHILDVYGSVEGEHTNDVVARLYASIVGGTASLPLHEMLHRIETNIGIRT